MSDRTMTQQLLARLQRHYIKPGDPLPGGVFVNECELDRRRVDALYIGFTSTRGHHMIGHELKVSRSDWLHELDQANKADRWARECHAWYAVAPSTAIVPPEELPHGWGLMVPSKRSKTRMDVVVKAELHPDREPSWSATHALLKRLDTLRSQAIADARSKADKAAFKTVEERVERELAYRSDDGREKMRADRLQSLVDGIVEILGVEVVEGRGWAGGRVGLDQLRTSFARFLAADRDADDALNYRLNALKNAELAVSEARAAVEKAVTS